VLPPSSGRATVAVYEATSSVGHRNGVGPVNSLRPLVRTGRLFALRC
jgi:hypothetical protein